MKLTVSHLRFIVDEIKRKAVGSYIGKLVEYTKNEYFFSLSKLKNERVVISLDSSHPFLSLTTFKSSSNTLSSPFYLALRKELDHAYLENIEIWNNDRIIAFTLRCTNEYYETNKRYLVIELITGNTNILLLDKDLNILMVNRPTTLDNKRPLLKGITYQSPIKNDAWNDNKQALPFDYLSLFEQYQNNLIAKRKKEKYQALIKLIKSQKKSLEKKLGVLKKEMQMAQDKDLWKLFGDYIFTYLSQIEKGASTLQIDDVIIPLDHQKSAKEMGLMYYKKYQKARNAEEHLQRQIKETSEKLEYFTILEEQWETASEKDLKEIEDELIEQGFFHSKTKKKKSGKSAISPYFCYFQNVKIGYGKNNFQNDTLTFHLAHNNHYFLHIKDHPGSHIVIFDSHPSKEVIEYACALALALSHKLDGDVIITPLNQVKKTNTRGLVQLNHYETIHISKYDKDLFTFLFEEK